MGDIDRVQPIDQSRFLPGSEPARRVSKKEGHNPKGSPDKQKREHPDIVELHDQTPDETPPKPSKRPLTTQQNHLDIEA